MVSDDGNNAPTHERRKLIKTYKYVLPQNRTVIADICGETYSKNDKNIDDILGFS